MKCLHSHYCTRSFIIHLFCYDLNCDRISRIQIEFGVFKIVRLVILGKIMYAKICQILAEAVYIHYHTLQQRKNTKIVNWKSFYITARTLNNIYFTPYTCNSLYNVWEHLVHVQQVLHFSWIKKCRSAIANYQSFNLSKFVFYCILFYSQTRNYISRRTPVLTKQ